MADNITGISMDNTIFVEQEPLTAPSVRAIYKTDELPQEYAGNPLIEALPGIMPHSKVIESLRREPVFDISERNFSRETRLHFVARLFWNFFQPMEQHIRIWDYLSVWLCSGKVLMPKSEQGIYDIKSPLKF